MPKTTSNSKALKNEHPTTAELFRNPKPQRVAHIIGYLPTCQQLFNGLRRNRSAAAARPAKLVAEIPCNLAHRVNARFRFGVGVVIGVGVDVVGVDLARGIGDELDSRDA